MPGGGAKRKLKKLKMKGDESQQIVEQLMGIFLANNIAVNFPWEIPNIVGQLINGQGGGMPNHQQSISQTNESLGRLRQLTTGHSPTVPPPALPQHHTHQAPQAPQSAAASPATPAVDPWDAVASGSTPAFNAEPAPAPAPEEDPWSLVADSPITPPMSAPIGAPASTPQDPPTSYDENGAPLSEAEMMARFDAAQARMMNRVATEGVKYKHGANGPAAGQKISPVNGVAVAPVPAQPAPAAPAAAPAGGGGGRRGMNGLTVEEARAVIARATGKDLKPPEANPNPKPPGM